MRLSVGSLLALFLLVAPLSAQEARETGKGARPKLIGLLMYADWCQSCKVLEPNLNEVKREFQDKGVLFTRFDLTDEFTTEQSRIFASWIGFNKIFEENRGRTGYMLLVEPQSNKVVGKLLKTQTPGELRSAIETALE